MAEPTPAQVAAFKQAWHEADDAGLEGERVFAGLQAVLPDSVALFSLIEEYAEARESAGLAEEIGNGAECAADAALTRLSHARAVLRHALGLSEEVSCYKHTCYTLATYIVTVALDSSKPIEEPYCNTHMLDRVQGQHRVEKVRVEPL